MLAEPFAETPMILKFRSIGHWLYRRAEHLLAAMLAVMFVAFVIQIVFRYVFDWPTGWTNELTVVCGSGWSCSARPSWCAKRKRSASNCSTPQSETTARRVMFLIAAVALIVLYGFSLPAVVDYVTFMRVEHTAYLKIRFDWLYSIYVVFAVATIVRYLWLAWSAMHGKAPPEFDPTKAASGV